MTTPPTSTEHSRSFKIIFTVMLAITAAWTVWCVQSQLDTIGDVPAKLVVR